jgi:hypothetical protein
MPATIGWCHESLIQGESYMKYLITGAAVLCIATPILGESAAPSPASAPVTVSPVAAVQAQPVAVLEPVAQQNIMRAGRFDDQAQDTSRWAALPVGVGIKRGGQWRCRSANWNACDWGDYRSPQQGYVGQIRLYQRPGHIPSLGGPHDSHEWQL